MTLKNGNNKTFKSIINKSNSNKRIKSITHDNGIEGGADMIFYDTAYYTNSLRIVVSSHKSLKTTILEIYAYDNSTNAQIAVPVVVYNNGEAKSTKTTKTDDYVSYNCGILTQAHTYDIIFKGNNTYPPATGTISFNV